ncbi:hypothetical protein ACFLU9_02115 [Chloroflexota bacterium]
MDITERIKTLNEEFQPIQEELKDILYDIRTRLMEATSPIPNDLERHNLGEFLNQKKAEKQEAAQAQSGSNQNK